MVDEHEKPPSFWRALRASEFWLLLVACFVSMYGVRAVIVIPLVVVGLSIKSLPKYLALWPKARATGGEWMWALAVAASFVNALAAACALVVFAALNRWFWGV